LPQANPCILSCFFVAIRGQPFLPQANKSVAKMQPKAALH